MENLNYWKGLQAPLQEEGASEHTTSGLETPAFFNRLAAREVKGRVTFSACRQTKNEKKHQKSCNLERTQPLVRRRIRAHRKG
jgi:hypothetical protein